MRKGILVPLSFKVTYIMNVRVKFKGHMVLLTPLTHIFDRRKEHLPENRYEQYQIKRL